MISFNPITIAKQELLKLDENHNHKPDVLEALEAGEKACETIKAFLGRFNEADAEVLAHTIYNSLMMPAEFKAKMPEAELIAFVKAVFALPTSLQAAEQVLKSLETELSH